MDYKHYIFIKEEERISSTIQIPKEFIDHGKNCFVGVYFDAGSNYTLIGVPKYYRKSLSNISDIEKRLILKHMKLVCSIIEQTRFELKYLDYKYNPYLINNEVNVNKVDLAEYLINDYLECGIYGFYQNSFIRDGSGINDWNKTVETEIPIIDDESVIYDPIIGRKSQYNRNDIISKIHMAVIKEALGILPWDEYQYVQLEETKYFKYEEDLTSCLNTLYHRINITFVEREKNLLKALIAWCGLTANNEKYYVGSTSFENIWEYAIDKVFGNIINKKSGFPSYYKLKQSDYISYKAKGDLIPDSLRIEGGNDLKYFHILDAKYYVWEENNNEFLLEHAPANSDISKQIGYYYYLYKLYGSKTRIFTNSFLVPDSRIEENKNWFSYWGYAQQNGIQNKEILTKLGDDDPHQVDLEKVSVFVVNPTRLYKMCLSNNLISSEYLKNIFEKMET